MHFLNRLTPSTTSLHTKLMLILALLVGLALISVTFVLIEHERQIRFAELEERADRMTDLISQSVAYSVWNVDLVAIDDLLTSFASDPEVVHVSVKAVGYGDLKEISKSPQSLINPLVRVKAINFSAANTDLQKIGEVRVVFSRALVEGAIVAAHRTALALVAIILAILYVGTFVLLKRLVSIPVNRLEFMVDRIASGDLDARCSVESNDELGKLGERVNMMAVHLKESDRSLRNVQENLSITLDSIGDAVIVTDEQGCITRMNPTAERLTGWLQANALNQHLDKVFCITNAKTNLPGVSPVQKVFEHGQIVALENGTVLHALDGRQYQIADSAAPIRKPNGDVVGVVLVFSDVSDKYKMEHELISTQRHMQSILDAIPDPLFEVDMNGLILRYHAHRNELLAAPQQNLAGKRFVDILPPEASQVCMDAIQDATINGWSTGATYALPLPQGETWFELSVAAMPEVDNTGTRFTVLARDITERKLAEAKLKLAANVFVNAGEGIMITDPQDIIVDVNTAFSRITGYSREEAIGQKSSILKSDIHDESFYEQIWRELIEVGSWNGEVWSRHKNGAAYAEMMAVNAVRDSEGNVLHYVAIFTDITDIKNHQSQLEYIAHFDTLTNLPNRVLLAERLQQAMLQAIRSKKQLVVAFLDLDGFKEINDRYSHEIGDKVLVMLSQRLNDILREDDTLARLGGDEFVAVIIDLEDPTDSLYLVERLLTATEQPIKIDNIELQVSASIGVTSFPQTQEIDAEQLMRQADQAMYQAKIKGKNRYHIFDAAQDNNLRWHHESLERICLALKQSEFVLYYQPKVNLRSGQIVGAEALIRWQHPEKGLLSPAEFLPTIEDNQISVAVGEWVIDTALTQLEQWNNEGLDFLEVSVNVGARQLQQDDFVERLRLLLSKHPQVKPSKLQIEVLETSALADIEKVSNVIEECARIGVEFAMDDFGTGYSSLTYLKQLNVAMLKIDQSFVRDMLDDQDDLAILQGVIGLAETFNRQVIAEGVETLEHGAALLKLGCELAQGYGIARPMPASDLPSWVADWPMKKAWHDLRCLDVEVQPPKS